MVHITPRRSDITRLPVDGSASLAEVARVVNAILDGRTENHGAVTLAMGTVETVIRSPIFNAHTILNLVPTSDAAAAIAWWQEEAADRGAIAIGHDAPGADVEFLWTAVG